MAEKNLKRERELLAALMPFARVAAIMQPLGTESWPDDRPNNEFLPTAWPDWGNFKRAFEVVGLSDGIHKFDAAERRKRTNA